MKMFCGSGSFYAETWHRLNQIFIAVNLRLTDGQDESLCVVKKCG